MAVFYRLHQDQSTGTKRSGKWYARAVPTACIGTRQLAEIIQRNCTVKKSDVMAVLEELVEVMKDQMQDSKRVKLDGFGSFKISRSASKARVHRPPASTRSASTSRVCTSSSCLSAPPTRVATSPSSSCRVAA